MDEKTETLDEIRSIDHAKEASTDLVALNNTVVGMRSSVKAAKVQIIHKLSRTIQKLKAKKGTEDQKVKNLRKAQRLLDEIFTIKELNADKVSKFALANKTSFAEVCKQPSANVELRSLVRLSEHKALAARVKGFRQEHSDWQELAAYLHSKQTGRRFKTKKQKLRAAKKGSKFLPDVSTSLNQSNAGVKRSVQLDQDTDNIEKTKQHVQSDSGDDDEVSGKVCDASDDESDENERENTAAEIAEEERNSSDNGSEGEDAASEDGTSTSSTQENTCEDNSDTCVLQRDEDESSSASDDDGWNSLSALPATKSAGKCEKRRKKSNAENENSNSYHEENSNNTDSEEEENSDDSNSEEMSSDGDESALEENSDENESKEENSDHDESVEEEGSDEEEGPEEDTDKRKHKDEETSEDSATEDGSKRTSSSKLHPNKSASKNKNQGKKCKADSDGTAILTKLPSESNIIKDPFFISGEEAEDDSGISSEEKSNHWIEKKSVDALEKSGGGRRGNPWHQRNDDRWLIGDHDQNDTWQHGDSHRGFRGRGRGRFQTSRGREDSWRGRGGTSRGRGDSWRSRDGGSNTFGGHGRGQGRGKFPGHSDRSSQGHRGFGDRFGDHSESIQTDWKKKKAAKVDDTSHRSREAPRKPGRGGFGARGGGHPEMRQTAWKVSGSKTTAKEEEASHPSWEAHRKRKLMEKTAAFSGKRIKFDD